MNKINNLVAGVAMLGAVASTQAQQVVKRITHNTNNTVVELFVLRNGTSLPNTTGPSNIDTGASDSLGSLALYNPALNNIYYKKSRPPTGEIPHGTEQIGNGTFNFRNNKTNTTDNKNYETNTEPNIGSKLDITIPQEDGRADSTQDNNTLYDMMYTKFILPHTLNDGSTLPDGLTMICLSRRGQDITTGQTSNFSRRLGLQRSLKDLSWKPISVDRNGIPLDNLQEIGNNGQVLGINDFDTTPTPQMKAYPNPATDTITLDDGDQLNNDFDFEIYDITGKKVGSGQGQEGQPINITNLTGGTYILSHKDNQGHRNSNKIIKK